MSLTLIANATRTATESNAVIGVVLGFVFLSSPVLAVVEAATLRRFVRASSETPVDWALAQTLATFTSMVVFAPLADCMADLMTSLVGALPRSADPGPYLLGFAPVHGGVAFAFRLWLLRTPLRKGPPLARRRTWLIAAIGGAGQLALAWAWALPAL